MLKTDLHIIKLIKTQKSQLVLVQSPTPGYIFIIIGATALAK
jgi:hypothetical protein